MRENTPVIAVLMPPPNAKTAMATVTPPIEPVLRRGRASSRFRDDRQFRIEIACQSPPRRDDFKKMSRMIAAFQRRKGAVEAQLSLASEQACNHRPSSEW